MIPIMREPKIYILDIDPLKCAEFHCDKHVLIRILETTEFLFSAHDENVIMKNHPSAIKQIGIIRAIFLKKEKHSHSEWVQESINNYRWLCEFGLALCKEYSYRWGKTHEYEPYIKWLMLNEPELPDIGLTTFRILLPDKYNVGDPVESYRTYYVGEKQKIASWEKRQTPNWFQKSNATPKMKPRRRKRYAMPLDEADRYLVEPEAIDLNHYKISIASFYEEASLHSDNLIVKWLGREKNAIKFAIHNISKKTIPFHMTDITLIDVFDDYLLKLRESPRPPSGWISPYVFDVYDDMSVRLYFLILPPVSGREVVIKRFIYKQQFYVGSRWSDNFSIFDFRLNKAETP